MITILIVIFIPTLYYVTYKKSLKTQCGIENSIEPVTSPDHVISKAFHEYDVKYCIENKQLDFLRKANSASKKVEENKKAE